MNQKIAGIDLATIYAKIVETSEQGICLLNLEGRIALVNGAFARMIGYEEVELIGKLVTDILSPQGVEAYHARREKRLAGKLRGQYELEFVHRMTGQQIFTMNSVSPIFDDNNQMVLALGVLTNITPLKEAQFELAHRAQELLENHKTIKEQEQALVAAAKSSALGEMAGQAAHEINTPLGAIVLTVESLLKRIRENSFEPKFFTQQVELILRVTQRVERIVQSMRKLAGQGGNDLVAEIQLKTLIEDTTVLCEARFKKNAIRFDVEFNGTESKCLQCVPSEISQVLINLLNNAYDACQKQPDRWVRLTLAEHDGHLRLTVTDSGAGISAENQKRMFTPNFTTKSLNQGTGFGLSISRKIAERHDGRLFFDSDKANTTFVFELPWQRTQMLGKVA